MLTVDYVAVGRKIKEKRKKCGFTQEKLAEICELSVSYIAFIESGKKSLSLETAVKISNALDVSLDYLLMDEIKDDNRLLDALDNELQQCTKSQFEKFLRLAKVLLRNIDEI